MEFGLIGRKLGHSWSKIIHAKLFDYDYQMVELPDEDAAREFFRRRASV